MCSLGDSRETHSGGLGSPEVATATMSREPCEGAGAEHRVPPHSLHDQAGRDSSSG